MRPTRDIPDSRFLLFFDPAASHLSDTTPLNIFSCWDPPLRTLRKMSLPTCEPVAPLSVPPGVSSSPLGVLGP